jgi:inosose dehydratase
MPSPRTYPNKTVFLRPEARALSRRALLASLSFAPSILRATESSKLLAQTYVFTQEFGRRKTTLADGVEEMFRTVHDAGFGGVELMPGFLAPDLRERALEFAGKYDILVPIVYTGGAMHDSDAAERSIANAVALAALSADAINMNPDPIGRPKTGAELATQADALNRLGRALKQNSRRLFVHHHVPEMADGAREWRSILKLTDPDTVRLCVDTHWAYRGGQDWMAIVREAGTRLASLHVRNSGGGVWSESFGPGDLDYRELAAYLRESGLDPYVVVELAYEERTSRTRTLGEDLRISRDYAQRLFGSGDGGRRRLG